MSRLYHWYRRGQNSPADGRMRDLRNPSFTEASELAGKTAEINRPASDFMAQTAKIAWIKAGESVVTIRGEYQTVAISSFTIAGVVVRYGFYAVGALVLGLIGIGILSVWSIVPKAIDAPPAFRITAGEFASKPTSGHVVSSSRLGRAEVLQYGQLYNRTNDLAVALVMPPKGIGMGTMFLQDLSDINLLRGRRMTLTQTHYDLDTRFGEYRATEMRVDTDGRWKQCLAYRSRFDTAAVYLTGWYCDGSGSKPSANALACILDKLVIERELASKEADTFLRGRMSKAGYCQAGPVTQTTDTGHRGVSPPWRWSQPSATYRRY